MNIFNSNDINGTPVLPGCRVAVATGWKSNPRLVTGRVYKLSLSDSGYLTVCVRLEKSTGYRNKRAYRGTSRMLVINP